VIRVTNVTHFYEPGKPVLRGVSLAVPRGAFVAIAGASGAGKSTLLSILNGMTVPREGTVEIAGADLTRASGGARRRIQSSVAMIYQDFRLVAECSSLENTLNGALARTALWRAVTGVFAERERRAARDALAAVGLSGMEDTPVSRLSGGQKQRVAIARALVQGAEIILADEPVASLDPGSAGQILALLQNLQQTRSLTVVMNSHSPDEARRYAERIVGLRDGRIVRDAPACEWTDAHFAELYRRQA